MFDKCRRYGAYLPFMLLVQVAGPCPQRGVAAGGRVSGFIPVNVLFVWAYTVGEAGAAWGPQGCGLNGETVLAGPGAKLGAAGAAASPREGWE